MKGEVTRRFLQPEQPGAAVALVVEENWQKKS